MSTYPHVLLDTYSASRARAIDAMRDGRMASAAREWRRAQKEAATMAHLLGDDPELGPEWRASADAATVLYQTCEEARS